MSPPQGNSNKAKTPKQDNAGTPRGHQKPMLSSHKHDAPPQRKRRYHRDIGVRCPPKVREDTTRTTKYDAPPLTEKGYRGKIGIRCPPPTEKRYVGNIGIRCPLPAEKGYLGITGIRWPPLNGKGLPREHWNTMIPPKVREDTAGKPKHDASLQRKKGYIGDATETLGYDVSPRNGKLNTTGTSE